MKAALSGKENAWKYAIIDNMFTSFTGTVPKTATYGMGWNMFQPFYTYVRDIFGYGRTDAEPASGNVYKLTKRAMYTTIQAPTQTPTWCEVYLLKPKRTCWLGASSGTNPGQNPLYMCDQGTAFGAIGDITANPGSIDPYTVSNGTVGTTTGYTATAVSNLSFNPFTDRKNYSANFKIMKVWKFALSGTSSKTIVMKSNKAFSFRPDKYQDTAGIITDMVKLHEQDTLNATGQCVDCCPDSRIMLIRWHGANCITDTTLSAANADGQIKCGTSADPIMVNRTFKFAGYTQDITEPVYAANKNANYEETTKGNLITFEYYNPKQTPYQN